MKTAISLPDNLFKSGDSLAKRLGISRSELYARALADFVAKYKASQLTQRLNAVYAEEESRCPEPGEIGRSESGGPAG